MEPDVRWKLRFDTEEASTADGHRAYVRTISTPVILGNGIEKVSNTEPSLLKQVVGLPLRRPPENVSIVSSDFVVPDRRQGSLQWDTQARRVGIGYVRVHSHQDQ